MGSGEWGDEGDEGDEGGQELITNNQCPMPNAQCPMSNAQFNHKCYPFVDLFLTSY
ncbi:MAG: hypothetical protein V7L05_29930 [Nostoc sp.]|uniref:hypothetical protein n=1 Tax=Nostoc sp. TaxID=1180 RepID=UPI002FF933A4